MVISLKYMKRDLEAWKAITLIAFPPNLLAWIYMMVGFALFHKLSLRCNKWDLLHLKGGAERSLGYQCNIADLTGPQMF